MFRLFVAFISLFSAAAFANEAPPALVSGQLSSHPLSGRIWSVKEERFVEPAALAAAARNRRFVLLGEIHDNPDHHSLQAWVIDRMAEAGRRPALVFEMIPADMQGNVDAFLAAEKPAAEAFGKAVEWQARGWPDWAIYRPLMQVALARELPVKAGDAAAAVRKDVAAKGLAALPAEDRGRLGLNGGLEETRQALLEETLFQSHCGLVPKPSLMPMATVQRLRDAFLADAMLAGEGDGAVLIAGGGHVRADFGVPLYLREREGEGVSLSIAFREVERGIEDPGQALAGYGPADPPYDFVWFTPGIEREDPCEDLRERFGAK